MHISRILRHGSIDAGRRPRPECTVEGCTKKNRSHGLCNAHLSRLQRNGSVDIVKPHPVKHGLWKHPLYQIWNGIKYRCLVPSSRDYPAYGGRGITICKRWREDFQAFYDDVAPRPEGLTLDRKNNNLHYSCGKCEECKANGWEANCRWVSRSVQNHNRRQRPNSAGYQGIKADHGRWNARIRVNKKIIHLGMFATKEEAAAAYESARKRYYNTETDKRQAA